MIGAGIWHRCVLRSFRLFHSLTHSAALKTTQRMSDRGIESNVDWKTDRQTDKRLKKKDPTPVLYPGSAAYLLYGLMSDLDVMKTCCEA